MSLFNSNTEQSQEKKAINKSAKKCKQKIYITIGIFLFIEVPQVASAWITMAEKMPLLQRGYTQVIEIFLKNSAK